MKHFYLPLQDADLHPSTPWLMNLCDGSVEEAKYHLRKHWESLKTQSFIQLADFLLESTKLGAVFNPPGYIFGLDNELDTRVEARWYLPSPSTPDVIENVLVNRGFDHNSAIVEFLKHFEGLRADLKFSGNFASCQFEYLDELVADDIGERIEGFEEWKDSLFFYMALDGSVAVVNRCGQVGWWNPSELKVSYYAECLDEFVAMYLLKKRERWPFDCYS